MLPPLTLTSWVKGTSSFNELKRQLQWCGFQPQFWLLLTTLLEIFWQTMCSCPGHSQNENIWRLFCPNKRAFEVKEAGKWTFYHFQKSRKMSLWHESSFELGSNVKILNFLEPVYLRMLQRKQILARSKKGEFVILGAKKVHYVIEKPKFIFITGEKKSWPRGPFMRKYV